MKYTRTACVCMCGGSRRGYCPCMWKMRKRKCAAILKPMNMYEGCNNFNKEGLRATANTNACLSVFCFKISVKNSYYSVFRITLKFVALLAKNPRSNFSSSGCNSPLPTVVNGAQYAPKVEFDFGRSNN